MTREEALEYVNNMWMYEDTKNALETLIPEFGKTGSDKVIDYEEKYKEALEMVRRLHDRMKVLSSTDALVASSELEFIFPELTENEDEKVKKTIRQLLETARDAHSNTSLAKPFIDALAWLEKQKENPKSSDSIPSDCTSDAKCEDRWHKVSDSLPDNGRLVLANDCLGNTLLARYDGEGNWEVSVYDNEDYYCRNTITKWCEIPSEKQKEQKPKAKAKSPLSPHELYDAKIEGISQGRQDVLDHPEQFGLQKPAEWKPQPESLEALSYAIEGEWEKIEPTSYLSRRLEDLYDGLVNTFDVDEKYLSNLSKTEYTEKDIEEIKALKEKIYSSMETKHDWSEVELFFRGE